MVAVGNLVGEKKGRGGRAPCHVSIPVSRRLHTLGRGVSKYPRPDISFPYKFCVPRKQKGKEEVAERRKMKKGFSFPSSKYFSPLLFRETVVVPVEKILNCLEFFGRDWRKKILWKLSFLFLSSCNGTSAHSLDILFWQSLEMKFPKYFFLIIYLFPGEVSLVRGDLILLDDDQTGETVTNSGWVARFHTFTIHLL